MIFESKHGRISVRGIHRFEKEVPYRNSTALVMQHTVQVTYNNEKAQFQFTSSITDYQAGKDKLSDDDLMYSFMCFLQDGLYYEEENFQDFCDTFGYEIWGDEPKNTMPDTGFNRIPYEIYEACRKSKAQAERIGITTDMSYDIIEELRAAGYE